MSKKRSRPDARREEGAHRLSRRGFLQGVGAAAGAAALRPGARAQEPATRVLGPGPVPVRLRVNGRAATVTVEPRVTLLNVLRNHLDLTGTKKICDRGSCGGCTVLVDGLAVNSCLMLALDAEGKEITTIEGLARGDELHPLQRAFCDHDALQCGFCTPGMIMACKALLDRTPNPTLDDVRAGIAGNICRCGTYNRIFAAVQAAAKRTR